MIDAGLGLSIAFNGCIYNYPELREQLQAKGHRFPRTPTPRCCCAYDRWGEDVVDTCRDVRLRDHRA